MNTNPIKEWWFQSFSVEMRMKLFQDMDDRNSILLYVKASTFALNIFPIVNCK